MKKRIVPLLLASALLISTAACSGNTEDTSSGDSTSSGNSSTDSATTEIDTSEHVTISYLTLGDIPTNETERALAAVNEILTEEVNAEMSLRWIEWADYTAQYNLALASQNGDLDLVVTASDWLDGWPNVQKDAFLPLSEEMLKTYAPKTWEQVDEAGHWKDGMYDGQIYLIPEDAYAQWINHGFMYRSDWAKEAGLDDGVHSWDDMQVYLQYLKDNKPDIIPWDVSGSTGMTAEVAKGWQDSHTDDITIDGFGIQLFWGESKDDPYHLSRFFIEGDGLLEFATEMKEWADAGYWRADVLNYTGDTASILKEGGTGAHEHITQSWYTDLRPNMDKNFPGSDLDFFYFGEETQNLVKLVTTHGAMAVAAQSQNPERALMVYDQLRFNQEVYDLMAYGFEGEQYTLDEETGMLSWTEGYDNATNGVTFNFWGGRNDDLERKVDFYAWEPYEEKVAEYEKVAIEYPYGTFIPDKDSLPQLENLANIYNTYMPQIAFGKMAGTPEECVEQFRNELKQAGYEEALAEVERQLQETYGG